MGVIEQSDSDDDDNKAFNVMDKLDGRNDKPKKPPVKKQAAPAKGKKK